ncbi:hypothetical protein EGR_10215 [Echinococcus granulosus]|uniref:Uncharacterized protein n=1 Tax=Echinococcus granulosus TaxID=6210 RepID=W6U1M5_ECHGR|nr:hypothetical protein EGR_10215 [Echinococcus granulosus]EUB54933.1 hypothetical protein EGR_10215 [Echinococcus granulosus]
MLGRQASVGVFSFIEDDIVTDLLLVKYHAPVGIDMWHHRKTTCIVMKLKFEADNGLGEWLGRIAEGWSHTFMC